MLTFAQALDALLRDATLLGRERVSLPDALGRVLAEPVRSPGPQPPFDHSAMDGWAVRTTDFEGPGPWVLPGAGEARTGAVAPALAPRSTCRIFTGAVLPEGADAVVMQEDVQREGAGVVFRERPRAGAHLRRAGEDLAAGAVALAAGTRLGPGALGLAASLDRPELTVARRPQVTLLCTGDELRAPGDPARPASIPDSNAVAVAALCRTAGAAVRVAPLVKDEPDATRAALLDALAGTDVLVTVGGVSVGDHDLVRDALLAVGGELDFWKVAIRPGKPLAWGKVGAVRVLGLPGNPASALVTATLFGVPLLRALQGDARPVPSRRAVTLTAPLKQKAGRLGFYRARLEGERATPLGQQASGAVTGMAWADALVELPADVEHAEVGTTLRALMLADA